MKLHAIYGTTYKDLEKENKHLNLQLDQALKEYEELQIRIEKAIEYCKREIGNIIANFDYVDTKDLENILEILGDKENE